ncbi:winged helix DNA-binding domain-containing protein [Amycolatopsis sp. cg5]|uniref:winged helix DNA-binding domain-containing protein n=1 Tax=Amycolatopsis sp. cg5 TaxID=3238802 RepID=UPI0035265F46
MTERLSRRALNRATLERQLLLRRAKMSALEAIEHLGGLQAQAPFPPYYALWARLQGFKQEELARLLLDREVVRIALMRGTVHLVTAADALAWRPLLQCIYDRDLERNTQHAANLRGLDHDQLAKTARDLLTERPHSTPELGAALATHWPDRAPASLNHAARGLLPLVQIPPRGIWGKSGQTTYATAEDWLGRPLDTQATPAQLILRYLAAFGPATVQDVQAWAGITRLGEIAATLDLRKYLDEDGRELLDLPHATVPDPDTPAPPRLLGPFDQTILSYADRTRIISDPYRKRMITQNGIVKGALLANGEVRGWWETKKSTIILTPFEKLTKRDLAALESAADRLIRWATPTAETHTVQVTPDS